MLQRFVNDIDKSPIKFGRVPPTQDTLEYSDHHGKSTLVKSTWYFSVGHDFGRALVVLGTEEGAQKAIENLDDYASDISPSIWWMSRTDWISTSLDGSIVYVSRAEAHMSESQTSQVLKVDGNKIHKDP